jgi:release factor glutamine methyltransferase
MIDLLKKCQLPDSPNIADIGTGSGCLGITAALEVPGSKVFLYDIDSQALKVAAQNIQHCNFGRSVLPKPIQVVRGDLLRDVVEHFDVILANLPYVPEGYDINKAARHEPRIALFAGTDGLALYRSLWQQVAGLDQRPRHVFTEALPEQHAQLALLAKAAEYSQLEAQGLIQHFVKIV